MQTRRLLLQVFLLLLATPPAQAVAAGEPVATESGPESFSLVDRPLTLPRGMLELGVGRLDEADGLIRVAGGLTDSVTLSATADGGRGIYRAGADASWSLVRDDRQEVALQAGAAFGDFAPTAAAATIHELGTGVWSGWARLGYKVRAGRFGLFAGARLDTGITQRDPGNTDRGYLELQPRFQVLPRLGVFVSTGVGAVTPLNGRFLGSAVAIPVSAGVLWEVARGASLRGFDLGAMFGFPNRFGPFGSAAMPYGWILARVRL
jgi:hypothetical protein